jgi:hypothetical protein
MRFKALAAAALAATTAVLTPMNTTALYVPDRFQGVIEAVGWAAADVPMLAQVIECESGWNSLAVGDGGRSLGMLQIRDSTWQSAQALDEGVPGVEHWSNPAANLYTGRVIHDREGFAPWACAR